MQRAVCGIALLSAVVGLPLQEIKDDKFHPDFPPKELIDSVSGEWRTRVARQNYDSIADWFRRNQPPVPSQPHATDRERELWSWGVLDYVEAFRAGKVTAVEYTRALLKRLEHYKALNTHIASSYGLTHVILRQAEAVDAKAAQEGREAVGPWYGLPVAVKGTVATVDFPSCAGSGVLHDIYAARDAGIVSKLKKGHAVIFGKTNTPEFAASYMTMNYRNGVTRNPHHPELSAGGSSGGSGSAVAARIVPIAVTEDTGGSTRHPANNNGNFGYDPPRNKYPNDGNPGMTYWTDQTGVNARSFADILHFDAAMTGEVGAHNQAAKAVEALGNAGVHVAFPEEYFQRYTVPEGATNTFGVVSCRAAEPIRNALARAKEELTRRGFSVAAKAEWSPVDNKVLGRVNGLYAIHFGFRVNGAHFEPFIANVHSMQGQIQSWIEQYLQVQNVTVGDVLNAARPVGLSHDPPGFMLAGPSVTESQHRFTAVHAEQSRQIWNSFFDAHGVDMIITPTQFTPALKYSEMVANKGPLERLQPDGSYKLEQVTGAFAAHIPIMLAFKHFPVPKIVVPLGTDSEGRPFSATIWGRSVDSEFLMYEDAHATYDIPFLHKAARVIRALQDAGIVRRTEPPTSAGISSAADEL